MKRILILCSMLAAGMGARADGFDPGTAVQLRSAYSGAGQCLDIVNAGAHDTPRMSACAGYSGQQWQVEPDPDYPEFVVLRTDFTGADACLDIVNDGANDKLRMSACAGNSGQLWRIAPSGRPQRWQLRALFTGQDKCLDLVLENGQMRPAMSRCGSHAGQQWSLGAAL
ncbi:MAG: ricin-type beta-trefoil lectin domain protein [Pseudomonadota bacterium]